MTTQAKIGAGTLLNRGDGNAPEAFTTVGEVNNIKGPSLSRDMKEATNMSSPGAAPNTREEVIPGVIRTGTVDFEVNYVRGNNQQSGLIADLKAGTLRNFQIVFPDDPTNPVLFAAYVQKSEFTTPVADKRILSVSLKISGDVTGI